MSPLWSDAAIAHAARAAAVARGVIEPAKEESFAANDNRSDEPRRPAPRTPLRRYSSSFAL